MAVAAVLAAALGAAPGVVFWFVVRHPDAAYPAGAEALALVAVPVVAGAVFAALCPRPVWRKSVVFTLVFGILPASVTVLAIYDSEPFPLVSGPLGVIAAWLLCWFEGALAAGLTSRLRTWRAGGGTPREWAKTWWRRRRCHHDWELEDTAKLPGRVGHMRYAGEIGHHTIRYYRCPLCGATKTVSDRWGPIADRRF